MENRDQVLEDLESTVGFLKSAATSASADQMATRPDGHVFALVEHICHLRDYEVEGFGARIQAVLDEDNPWIDEFDGTRIAEQRRYVEQDWKPALSGFVAARVANVARLRALPEAAWDRPAMFHGFGPTTLGGLATITRDHDAEHIREVLALGGGCPIWPIKGAA